MFCLELIEDCLQNQPASYTTVTHTKTNSNKFTQHQLLRAFLTLTNAFVKTDSQGWKTHEEHKLISTEALTEDATVKLTRNEKKQKNFVSAEIAIHFQSVLLFNP